MEPIGFNSITCLSDSDTVVSVPFIREPLVHAGRLGLAPVSSNGTATLTPSVVPSWVSDQLVNPRCYMRFTSGVKAGMWYDITGNTAHSFDIDLRGDSPAGVEAGDTFLIAMHWTLDSLFPPGTQTAVHLSVGDLAFQKRTRVLFPNISSQGIDLPAAAIFYLTTSGWFLDGASPQAAGSTIVPPGMPFVIRHRKGDPSTIFAPSGRVVAGDDTIPLSTSAVGAQDNPVALMRPVPSPFDGLGLSDDNFEQSMGHFPSQRRDQLLMKDNASAGIDKAFQVFYKFQANWYLDEGKGDSNPLMGKTTILPAGEGVVIRKFQADGFTVFWVNTPTY